MNGNTRRSILKSAGVAATGGLLTGTVNAEPGQELGSTHFIEANFETELPQPDTPGARYNLFHADIPPEYVLDLRDDRLYLTENMPEHAVDAVKRQSGVVRARGHAVVNDGKKYASVDTVVRPRDVSYLPLSEGETPEAMAVRLADSLTVPSMRLRRDGSEVNVSIAGASADIPAKSDSVLDLGTRTAKVNLMRPTSGSDVPSDEPIVDNPEDLSTDPSVVKDLHTGGIERVRENIQIDLKLRVRNVGELETVDATDSLVVKDA